MKVLISLFVLISGILNFAAAQDETNTAVLFGNQDQPGTIIHASIQTLMADGQTLLVSSETVINEYLVNAPPTKISPLSLQAISADKSSTLVFIRNMVTLNSLFEATKLTIESSPENITSIINITVSLYPDFAQEIINAVVMTGEMDSNEALFAAIAAGADPTTVSEATAAGGSLATTISSPVGVGNGAGGAGGGDATASSN